MPARWGEEVSRVEDRVGETQDDEVLGGAGGLGRVIAVPSSGPGRGGMGRV